MKKTFFTLIIAVLANLIVKPLWVLTENKVQDLLGHETIGLYAAIFSLAGMFIVFTDLGINQWFTISLANEKDTQNLQSIFPKVLFAKLLLSLTFYALVMIVGVALHYHQHSDIQEVSSFELLNSLVIYHLLIALVLFQRSILQGFHAFRLDALLGNIDKLILLGLVYYRIENQLLTLKYFLNCLWISGFVTIAVGLIFIYFSKPKFPLKAISINPDFQFLQVQAKHFLPFALMTILFSVNERINQVMLEQLDSEESAGLFAGAYRWSNAIAMYLWTILPVFFAKFADKSQSNEEIEKLFHLGWVMVAVPIIFVTGWVNFYVDFLFIQFGNSNSQQLETMYSLLKILIITVLLNACFNIFSTWLSARGFVKETNLVLTFSLMTNAVFSWLFIPQFGAVGAAYALLLAFVVQSLGFFYFFLQKKQQFRLQYDKFLKSFLICSMGIFCLWCGKNMQIFWILNTFFSISVIAAGVFLFKIIEWKKL